jgi:hypothetical protein
LNQFQGVIEPSDWSELSEKSCARTSTTLAAAQRIQSSLPLPVHFVQDFIPSDFIEVLSPSNELLSSFSVRNIVAVVAVVAGCDTGVILTDGLSGNDSATSLIRRYKDQMHVALEECGLRHINTTVFTSFEGFSSCSNAFDDKTSFVIKPINSAGSEGVRFAKGRRDLAEAMKALAWGQVNVLGEINDGFVVQPFIKGPEYVIDMVATSNWFFVASVCQCHKVERNGSKFVCDYVDLLDPQMPS